MTMPGSSPRVRGKLQESATNAAHAGLIPACAGKTRSCFLREAWRAAHPRVCGENFSSGVEQVPAAGSSPRVRGKQAEEAARAQTTGLIPACAGKTSTTVMAILPLRAHPRVCGENSPHSGQTRLGAGSSPRVRGKRPAREPASPRLRLIPACAGKTAAQWGSLRVDRAHPRVCGENNVGLNRASSEPGSSPRVRGKRAFRGTKAV